MEDGAPAGALFFERTGVEGSVVNHGPRGVVEDAGWGGGLSLMWATTMRWNPSSYVTSFIWFGSW
jgi:hypothetical protein